MTKACFGLIYGNLVKVIVFYAHEPKPLTLRQFSYSHALSVNNAISVIINNNDFHVLITAAASV